MPALTEAAAALSVLAGKPFRSSRTFNPLANVPSFAACIARPIAFSSTALLGGLVLITLDIMRVDRLEPLGKLRLFGVRGRRRVSLREGCRGSLRRCGSAGQSVLDALQKGSGLRVVALLAQGQRLQQRRLHRRLHLFRGLLDLRRPAAGHTRS